jgi:hypothetical protein
MGVAAAVPGATIDSAPMVGAGSSVAGPIHLAVAGRLWPDTAGQENCQELRPTGVRAGQGPFFLLVAGVEFELT